jgi:hypothetical protein
MAISIRIDQTTVVFGRLAEEIQSSPLGSRDKLVPQLPHECVLVTRCDAGELYVQTFYELLTQTFSTPSQRRVLYATLQYPVALGTFFKRFFTCSLNFDSRISLDDILLPP